MIDRVRVLLCVLLAGALAACGGPSRSDAAGPDSGGVDAGATDAGGADAGPADAGPADSGGTDSGGLDAGTDPDVARCMAAAALLMATCPTDGHRTCHVGAYGTFCQAGAHPGNFADAIDCLRAGSSASSGCRTFSDPSGTQSCTAAAYAGVTSAAVDSLLARVHTLCSSTASALTAEPPLYGLSATQLSSLSSCVDAAADCAAATVCATTASGPIAACYPTP